MLSAPTSPVVAGLQALVVAAFLLMFGYLLASALMGSRGDRIQRAGLALPALCGYVLLLSLAHIVSGGALWSHPWIGRVLTTVVALGAWSVVRRRGTIGDWNGVGLMLGLVALGLLVWGLPVFRELPLFETTPLDFGSDTKLHLGWAMQLLNGETTPSSPLTGEIPNYYPWFFHAFLAFVSNFTPGGRAFHGLGPLQLVQVGGGILTLFALGREVTGRLLGASAAASLGALSGGIGWIVARGAELETNRENPMTYLGDLALVRSYNSSFHNLAPTLPRDLTYVLVPAFLFLLVNGLRDRRRPMLLAAGGVAGVVGLTGAEAFFLCGLIALGVGFVAPAGDRVRTVAWVALPMAAVWSMWLVPLAWNYVRLGGFVDTTTVGTVDVPPLGILGAWGLLTVFSLVGLVHLWSGPRGPVERLLAVAVAAAAFLLLIATIAGDSGPLGVIGRPHRYWPLLYLALVPIGAVGVVALSERFRSTSPRDLVLGTAILALAVPSPILGSLALSRVWSDPPPLVSDAIEAAPRSVLEQLDPSPGGETCVAAVPEDVVHSAFWWSGYRFVHYRWTPETESNFARIRWADMDEHIPWDEERASDNPAIDSVGETSTALTYLEDKYGVDIAITSAGDVIERTDCGP
jgi:hypothetical protein